MELKLNEGALKATEIEEVRAAIAEISTQPPRWLFDGLKNIGYVDCLPNNVRRAIFEEDE